MGPGDGRPGDGGTRTRCICGSVTTRIPTVWSKTAAAGQATRHASGVKPFLELGPSLTKLENRFEVCFTALQVFPAGGLLSQLHCRAFLFWWSLTHPRFFGAVAQSATGFLFHVYWRSFPRAPSPLPRPCTACPLCCPSRLPTPPSRTSRPDSPRPHPALYHQPLPFWLLAATSTAPLQLPRPSLAPLRVPRSSKLPSFSRASEPGSLQRASLWDGWEWGVGDVIREIPALGWAGRGLCNRHSPQNHPCSF